MTYEINVTEQADTDLRKIYEYIAFELQSPENASGQLVRLENAILTLDQFPDKHRLYEHEPWRSRGLRIFPVDHYLIFYIAERNEGNVFIIRIMYGGRDVEQELREHTEMP